MIHYISCHSVLEYDEVKLLTELGYEVFSNGAYTDPKGAYTLPRPGIPGAKYYPEFADLARTTPKTALPPGLIEPFDTIIIMHSPEVLFQNWERIKHKRVIWRSIGQSTGGLEERLKPLVAQGLEIMRYSPKEQNIANYAGQTHMVRFYKDPNEFKGWTGETGDVVNFTQTLKGRREFCHFDEVFPIIEKTNGKVYGTGNDDLGAFNGGEMPYEMQKDIMRKCGAYIYGGTWPASYTLSLIEAMMTGCPVIAVGKNLAQNRFEVMNFYEVEEIIEQGISGFHADTMGEMLLLTQAILGNKKLAKEVSTAARDRAIELFGKDTIAKQWQEILG